MYHSHKEIKMKKLILLLIFATALASFTGCLTNKALNSVSDSNETENNDVSLPVNIDTSVEDTKEEIKYNADEIAAKLKNDMNLDEVYPILGLEISEAIDYSKYCHTIVPFLYSFLVDCGDSFIFISGGGYEDDYKGITWKIYNDTLKSNADFEKFAENLETEKYGINEIIDLFGMPYCNPYSGMLGLDYMTSEGDIYTLYFNSLSRGKPETVYTVVKR